jgi:hypothetical protein
VVLEQFGRVTLWGGTFVVAAAAALAMGRLPSPAREAGGGPA